MIERPNSEIWHNEKIDLEKSFSTNPNMTYFACVKAEIIASEKSKKLTFFNFRRIERVNGPKMTLKARFCLQTGSFNCSNDVPGSLETREVIHHFN